MTTPTRPVFDRLPLRGYQDNPLVDALLSFYDEKLRTTGENLVAFFSNLNPDTVPANRLDWLAYLVGMVPPYYDYRWSTAVKRLAVKTANQIFSLRGTLAGLKAALDIHGISYTIQSSSLVTLPVTLPVILGGALEVVWVKVPLIYAKNGYEYKEIKRAAECYTPATIEVRGTYDKFYIGYSTIGDGVFND